jgi:hypothetical protein
MMLARVANADSAALLALALAVDDAFARASDACQLLFWLMCMMHASKGNDSPAAGLAQVTCWSAAVKQTWVIVAVVWHAVPRLGSATSCDVEQSQQRRLAYGYWLGPLTSALWVGL